MVLEVLLIVDRIQIMKLKRYQRRLSIFGDDFNVVFQVLFWLHVVQVVKRSLPVQTAQDKGEPGKHN